MKIDDNELIIREISVLEFWFLDRWIGTNKRWDEQFIGAKILLVWANITDQNKCKSKYQIQKNGSTI
jgi:hypothetical protein